MAVLAIDLGTITGWAFNPADGVAISGTWDLHPQKGETEGERYRRFRAFLDCFMDSDWCTSEAWLDSAKIDVVYEDVRRHLGTTAAHVYGGLLATLKVWCLEHGLSCAGVGVSQIKKFWTRSGNASKDQMIAEARARGFAPTDDNEADALALLHLRIVEGPPVATAKPKREKTTAASAKQARRRLAR